MPLIVRWPSQLKAGTTSDQMLCLTDVMATLAAVSGAELPNDAAEDSFNMLPVLQRLTTEPVRPYLLTQAFGGQRTLSIRSGYWKYVDHRGSGGNNYDSPALQSMALPETEPDAPGQLYNLADDPGETTNLIRQHADIAAQLKQLLDRSKATGRSRP